MDDKAPEKRIRHVHILYHLEDDSISILEPRVHVRIKVPFFQKVRFIFQISQSPKKNHSKKLS
jgi:hypothetical protein